MEIVLAFLVTLVPFVGIVAAGLYVEGRWIGPPQHRASLPD